jgi:hypothetical protein
MSFAHAIREVSWEGGSVHESQQSAVASPRAACGLDRIAQLDVAEQAVDFFGIRVVCECHAVLVPAVYRSHAANPRRLRVLLKTDNTNAKSQFNEIFRVFMLFFRDRVCMIATMRRLSVATQCPLVYLDVRSTRLCHLREGTGNPVPVGRVGFRCQHPKPASRRSPAIRPAHPSRRARGRR